jgi:hypothetical protein
MQAIAREHSETKLELSSTRWRCAIEFQTVIKNVT